MGPSPLHTTPLQVIRMLFVIIVEFFVCWAPLHILNTVYLYSPTFVYQYVNSSGIALVQLMAYISSCCNPITYCFMNRRFRQAFLGVFSCYRNRMPICCCFCCASSNGPMEGAESKAAAYLRQNTINQSGAERNNSDMSGNDSLVYVGRGLVQRSGKLCARRSGTFPRYHRDAVCNALPWDLKITGSDHVNSSVSIVNSISSARIAQIIETDPDDDSFRLRITWSKPTSANYSKTAGGCDSERYS
uniref:G-protein coupled receptors family 1 profile domain-containing protein n=1 Tax=Anopheles melas TaxID=34690 RepID=A0A182TM47_9DIPT